MYSLWVIAFNKFPSPEQPRFETLGATLADAEAMIQVLEKAWLATYPDEETGITRDDIENHFQKSGGTDLEHMRGLIMQHKKRNDPVLVARKGGNVVGFVMGKRGEERNQITALYVEPASQKEGLGKALLLKILVAFGVEKDVAVEVVAANISAIRFYQQFGFEDTGKLSALGYVELANKKQMPELLLIRKGLGREASTRVN